MVAVIATSASADPVDSSQRSMPRSSRSGILDGAGSRLGMCVCCSLGSCVHHRCGTGRDIVEYGDRMVWGTSVERSRLEYMTETVELALGTLRQRRTS